MMKIKKMRLFWSSRGKIISSSGMAPQLARISGGDVRNIDLRHLHNRFGWQAGGNVLCAGALYRTEAFITLPDEQRCGNKVGQTIHIEHTVPVVTLVEKPKTRKFQSSVDALIWLLGHSVTVAVRAGEGKSDSDCKRSNMVHAGQSRRTHVFEAEHEDEGLPFRRYDASKHSKIWDVVNQRSIDPDRFSFAEHRANMSKVLE
ncbi:hypothetical protein OKC48_25730 [Methylorubrum extorquens]|uniref:hypothetical protein n=1 Tax=Methylorubrum extorquens TaxID=408 RepID=UPI00223775F4|nr:hypothetical protein [Methylorubrum extorquens]UYW26612.1 hypothetical protein OKC48_25730 [Methylorubrum extorquens]